MDPEQFSTFVLVFQRMMHFILMKIIMCVQVAGVCQEYKGGLLGLGGGMRSTE